MADTEKKESRSMKVRFTGDPRYRDNPEKASDPSSVQYGGKTFRKGEWVTIEGDQEQEWIDNHAQHLQGNNHFEVDNQPAAPGLKAYQEDAEQKRREDEARKAREEIEAREAEMPGHSPDRGQVADVGQVDNAPPVPGSEAMVRGFESVDDPTQSPSRNPDKREALLRERDQAPRPRGRPRNEDARAEPRTVQPARDTSKR